MGKSKNPAYPDADPTAPGGMSQKALINELLTKHGWTEIPAHWKRGQKHNLRAWNEMIDAVCQERLNREAEQKQVMSTDFNEVAVSDSTDLFDEFEDMLSNDGSDLVDESTSTEDSPLLILNPDNYDYIFDGHAGASPSGAERWMNCTASLAATREFLETLTDEQQIQFASGNSAARQGTTAHAAAEIEARVILGEMERDEADMSLLELTIEPADGEFYDEEMAEYITEYVDTIHALIQERGEENVLIEARVSAAIPLTDGSVYEITGSSDCIGKPTEDHPELVVEDLKFGKGIEVEAEGNPQARIYALGALGLLADEDGNLTAPVDKITYVIAQPRLGGMKTWSESLDDLLDWRDDVLSPALSAALAGPPEAEYNPSDETCQWCPARGGCAALAHQRTEAAAGLFDAVVESEYENGPGSFPETTSLTDTRLGELLNQISGLIDLHKDLKEEASRRLLRGNSVPGFKLVSFTPPRKWSADAAETLADMENLFVSKMVTPTQALKMLGDGASQIEDYIESPEKRPIIAPESSNRKEWTGTPAEGMFRKETGDEE